MGMFSEANAEANAKQLEKIILDLIKGNRWRDCRSAARGVAKEKLYPWYLSECSEAFEKPNPEIINEFEPKSQPEKPSCWDSCIKVKHGTIEECQNCADRPDGYNMYKNKN
jgi:hypothetical protein